MAFTGLYHVGAREYDPRTARWLQRDPIGVAGGNTNVYLYCFNNPINYTDPEGTRTCADILRDIETAIKEAHQAISDIIPEEDAKGGHPYMAGGQRKTTQPLGHCEEAAGTVNKLKSLWDEFTRKGCWKQYQKEAGSLSKRTDNLIEYLKSKIIKTIEYLQKAVHEGRLTVEQAKQAINRLKPHIKRLGIKISKAILKKLPIIGWLWFGYEWYTGGFRHAFDEATWPLSELWN